MACFDTTLIVDILQGKIDLDFFDRFDEELIIASPTIMEIYRGLNLQKNIKNIKEDEIEKIDFILKNAVIMSLDEDSAKIAGQIEAEIANKGHFIGVIDIMIAAIAIKNNQTLVTRNKKHFERIPNLKIMSY